MDADQISIKFPISPYTPGWMLAKRQIKNLP